MVLIYDSFAYECCLKDVHVMFGLSRPIIPFVTTNSHLDTLFSGERFEEDLISKVTNEHCTFESMGFLKTKFDNVRFFNCIFINFYFRRAEFKSSQFTSCLFISCNFTSTKIQSCDFKFSRFRDCAPQADEMSPNLPNEPGLCFEVSNNLSIEMEKLGHWEDARAYRIRSLKAKEGELKSIVINKNSYYEAHYNILDRLSSLVKLILSKANYQIWGYGERSWILLRNILLLIFLFPILGHISPNLFLPKNSGEDSVSFLEMFLISTQTVLPIGKFVELTLVESSYYTLIINTPSFLGLVFSALVASLIFRRIVRQ